MAVILHLQVVHGVTVRSFYALLFEKRIYNEGFKLVSFHSPPGRKCIVVYYGENQVIMHFLNLLVSVDKTCCFCGGCQQLHFSPT